MVKIPRISLNSVTTSSCFWDLLGMASRTRDLRALNTMKASSCPSTAGGQGDFWFWLLQNSALPDMSSDKEMPLVNPACSVNTANCCGKSRYQKLVTLGDCISLQSRLPIWPKSWFTPCWTLRELPRYRAVPQKHLLCHGFTAY